MVQTRSHRFGPRDTTERSATSRPVQQGPGTAAPLVPSHVGASATFGAAPPHVRRPTPVIPDGVQQQPPSGSVDAAQLFAFFQQMMKAQQRQSADFGQDIDNAHQLAMTIMERVTAQPQGGQMQQYQPRTPGI
ncbi:uncharacterized protein M6B38_125625 [Iris pallida]|uniref:Uncharacterized protein n=1 Tax=Iris pallida TaxID=29817 RepID=A0AAX6GP79_IRIPA|nr:uncharacterized protein M6B38_125625 [Iris pallida]